MDKQTAFKIVTLVGRDYVFLSEDLKNEEDSINGAMNSDACIYMFLDSKHQTIQRARKLIALNTLFYFILSDTFKLDSDIIKLFKDKPVITDLLYASLMLKDVSFSEILHFIETRDYTYTFIAFKNHEIMKDTKSMKHLLSYNSNYFYYFSNTPPVSKNRKSFGCVKI